jgi:uncharacterized protein (DUF302 family)
VYRIFVGIAATLMTLSVAMAAGVTRQDGWVVIDTAHSFPALVSKFESAVKAEKMGLVTSASASEGAKAGGVSIPGNRIVGVFRNDFARRMLSASISAGIEAPIRFYIVENSDGKATLSYKKPTFVFAPYLGEGGDALKTLATELDNIFMKIAEGATKAN